MGLQHRGQETCGIATSDGSSLYVRKGKGLVDQVFAEQDLEWLKGPMGIGHVGTGEADERRIQPVVVERPVRLALCYDGMVLNIQHLREKAGMSEADDATIFAQILSNLLAEDRDSALAKLFDAVKGPFSFAALTEGGEMICGRDRSGLRPLAIGNFGFDYGVIASESCAMDVIGADFKSDVQPGEIYHFTRWGIERKRIATPRPRYCAFEYVYFARPDSIINGRSVYDVRLRIGEKLAKESAVPKADIVLGVPETAIPAAMAYANKTRKRLGMGFVQTGRRVRSAIRPTQFERLVGVQLKLNPVRSAVAGRRVVLVDDSVVRGNTTRNTVNVMRNKMGAKEIHVRIGSPRIIAQCPFGVEVPPKDELIAANLRDDEVSKVVGADSFRWLGLDGLADAIGFQKDKLCVGCFSGRYPKLDVNTHA